MNCLVLISCCWLLKKSLVITTNLTNPESASDHLAYIKPRWCGSRISADCQQNLLSTKHGTSEKYLHSNFSRRTEEREDSKKMVDRDCVKIKSLANKELVSWDESELKFEDNFFLFFLASGFYIINCNSRCIKAKSDHFSQKKGFTSDYFKLLTLIKTAREERRWQVLILLVILLLLMSILISTANYISKVESLTLRKQIPQENQWH